MLTNFMLVDACEYIFELEFGQHDRLEAGGQ